MATTLNLQSPLLSHPALRKFDPAILAANYLAQVERLEAEVEAAARVTNHGAGAENGVRYKGLFYHQWVSRLNGARESVAEIFITTEN